MVSTIMVNGKNIRIFLGGGFSMANGYVTWICLKFDAWKKVIKPNILSQMAVFHGDELW